MRATPLPRIRSRCAALPALRSRQRRIRWRTRSAWSERRSRSCCCSRASRRPCPARAARCSIHRLSGRWQRRRPPPPPSTERAARRVAECAGGKLNGGGLANPGLATVREHELPWLAARLTRARVLVNVAGATVADYVDVIAGLTGQAVIAAFEINASCPNTTAGGLEFGATPEGLRELVRRCRAAATKPISVKLSPVLPDIVAMARIAQDEGADAVTLVHTIPGMLDRP